MIPLEKDIEVLQKALKNPPKGASKEEMSIVKQRLESSLKSKERAIHVLLSLGVDIELRRNQILKKKND